jgi:hypothetical protein
MEVKAMRAIQTVLITGILLLAASGCATTRNSQPSVYRTTNYQAAGGEYRPWNDVNSGGLPSMRWWGYGGPTWNFSNSNSPNYGSFSR